ncbi:[citrate (pro-3S)-lyase] ligase [Treponema vincentii]|uniref:[citrate (pro-3S)-lyase] ligase n=1 Tax=Treponema vincentii TaxID=69710 RepID=UPI003D8BD972
MTYQVRKIFLNDPQQRQQVIDLLESDDLHIDSCLDTTYGLFDEADTLAATASAYKNTLRCIAVRKALQGEGLLPPLMSELIADRNERGFFNLFIYTKREAAPFFERLGFYPIVTVADTLVFLENKKNGFEKYLVSLQKTGMYSGTVGAIVMNANPFTIGHYYLVEQAAAAVDHLHLFMVSDDASAIPFAVRERLIKENTAHFKNISYHRTQDYLISSATFPAYFLRDSDEAIALQAALDADIFIAIAHALNITHRFVGDEPFSHVTGLYNRILQDSLPAHGVQLHVIPRKTENGVPISASAARRLLQQEDWTKLAAIVPPATLRFFQSPEGSRIIQSLKQVKDITHY